MALVQCSECGHDVSTAAVTCPNCGAPLGLAATPPPPPPPAPASPGLWQRLKAGYFGLPRFIQVGWISLAIALLFTAAFAWARLGIVVAFLIGVVALFRRPRSRGVLLIVCAIVGGMVLNALTNGGALSHYSHKQQLVSELQISFRPSLLNESTRVLKIYNPNAESVDFSLRCYDRDGDNKTFFVSAPALGTREIGILETGWVFVPGEKVEAISEGDIIWRNSVP